MEVTITMDAGPERYTDGRDIIEWYRNTGYLYDFLSEFANDNEGTMIFNNDSGRYEIRFIPNDSWPSDVKEQAKHASILEHPDDDGNYLIDGNYVDGIIRSINEVEFYEWKEIKYGKNTPQKKFVLKSEYNDVL